MEMKFKIYPAGRKLFCEMFGWHKPGKIRRTGRDNVRSKCKYCGKKILRDSQGNWF